MRTRTAKDIREIWLTLIGIVVATTLLGACKAFVEPETLEQRLAYAYGTHTAVLNTAASGVALGELTPEEGESVLALADRALLILDSARFALNAGDPRTAEGQLRLALGVLTELQDYLRRQPPARADGPAERPERLPVEEAER